MTLTCQQITPLPGVPTAMVRFGDGTAGADQAHGDGTAGADQAHVVVITLPVAEAAAFVIGRVYHLSIVEVSP